MRRDLTSPTGAAWAALDRRLQPGGDAPLAVGLSGGGDSLALLILVLDWARPKGRRVLALSVDHGLNPASAGWTATALAAAARLGAETRPLLWRGDKPTTGLPAAAREARHRLLAAAARDAGARVLLLGHTADDLSEAAIMRTEGCSVGDPREWAPSPVWPEGRDLFLLRPLLAVRRAALRDLLRSRGETWLDDPTNADPRFARARARMKAPGFAGGAARSAVTKGALASTRLAAAVLCSAGHDRPPRGSEVERLAARLAAPGPVRATLGGARIEADQRRVRFARELGRAGLPSLALPIGEPVVWDGRYELRASAPGFTVRPLAGLARRLAPAERAALAAVPALARPALPAIVDAAGTVSCPVLATHPAVSVVSLATARWRAACGLVTRETPDDFGGGDPARGETERGVLSWSREFRVEGR